MSEILCKRDMIFISHANPEDNQFALWLSLRLANCQYPAWCDLTKLLGGEYFWDDVEEAIRERTQKFLFVLSRTSNQKPGALDELNLALTVERSKGLDDFVIPLRIDDLQSKDFHIRLQRKNAVPFNEGWASGLKQLLAKLEKDNVQKDPRFNPGAVNTWWRASTGTDCRITNEPEEYLSNCFPIECLPPGIYMHTFQESYWYMLRKNRLPYPHRRHRAYLISFADVDNLTKGTPLEGVIVESKLVLTQDFLRGMSSPVSIMPREAQNMVIDLLKKSWENMAWSALWLRKLGRYRKATYFQNDYTRGNRVKAPLECARARDIVGCRNRRDQDGNIIRTIYWHFALEARPILSPFSAFFIIPHVLFSYDGRTIWELGRKTNGARRSYCKDWWNPEWRDRTLGMMDWLGKERGYVQLSLGAPNDVQVNTIPITFHSSVSYIEPQERPKPEPEADFEDESIHGELE